MKRFKINIGKVAASLLVVLTITSCDNIFDLDINKNPNSPTEVTPDLLLPTIMLNGAYNLSSLGDAGQGFTGASYDVYTTTSMSFTSFQGTWTSMYSGALKDLNEVFKYIDANIGDNPSLARYLGVAQVLKAYYFSVMVDLWGDVPYSEAFNANNPADPNQNPKYDDASAIYDDLLKLCDDAVTNLNATSSVSLNTSDPMYGGSVTRWIELANTLKLRLLIQTSKVRDNKAAIDALVAAPGSLISATTEDWQFGYGKALTPDYRHPWFQSGYGGGENGFSYMLHEQMVEMLAKKDPRWPFFYKRQTKTVLNQDDPTERSTTPCSQTNGCYYSYVVLSPNACAILNAGGVLSSADPSAITPAEKSFLAGVFGRDRGDIAGTPLDGTLRTAPGVYPGAGLYDDTEPTTRKVNSNSLTNNNYGNGITPVICYYNTLLYRIEGILSLGTEGGSKATARTLFEAAMRAHIAKVVAFGTTIDGTAVAAGQGAPPAVVTTATSTNIDAYVNARLADFDLAANPLQVVLREAAVLNFGNGIEVYNTFRRTGYPQMKQPITHIRQFPVRLPYSSDDITLNKNAPNPVPVFDDPSQKLFWDVIGYQFPN